MVPDFSGYATKAGLKCSDGRTIMPDAFKHQDKMTVPLVWQHGHNKPENVLGHAVLENRPDGVYTYAYFNNTPQGQNAKALVEHKDITQLSIYANQLIEKSKQVFHGMIKEVSLVIAGANPGAMIDQVMIQHADGDTELLDDAAIIYTGLTLEHQDMPAEETEETEEVVEHASDDATLQDVYDSLDEDQKNLVHYMIGAALEQAGAKHSDTESTDSTDSTDNNSNAEDDLEHQEGSDMSRNVFEQGKDTTETSRVVLSHSDVKEIVDNAQKIGSFKAAVEEYALAHGITDIDMLFPDARTINNTPEWDKRRTEWVAGVLSGTRHSPFSRIKTMSADITQDEARAKGYIKGTLKKEEWFGLAQRVTTPTTIYKKQKLDRDDIIDITDMDVVAWLKGEMRLMLEEEVARAILIGDGRDPGDEDKIQDGTNSGVGIRPIANEAELYATTLYVNLDDASSSMNEVVDAVIAGRKWYKGTGTPTFYTTETVLSKFLLSRDTLGRRIYRSADELATELRVASIVTVEVMEDVPDLVGIIVNLQDYVVGADKGGEVNMFDDFDIDYNQYKYLIETRLSGALTKIKSALVIRKTASTNVLVVPEEPGFVASTGVVTIPSVTGVVYKDVANATVTAGAKAAILAGASVYYKAVPATGYYFADNASDEWTFTRDA
jgi:HK97 family phage prohead protease